MNVRVKARVGALHWRGEAINNAEGPVRQPEDPMSVKAYVSGWRRAIDFYGPPSGAQLGGDGDDGACPAMCA